MEYQELTAIRGDKMLKRLTILCMGLICTGLLACVEGFDDEPSSEEGADQQGLNITTSTQTGSDVTKMRYTLTPVKCKGSSYKEDLPNEGAPIVTTKKLKEMALPGGIPTFENRPFDENSQHRFADFLKFVPTGCYDVNVEPMRGKKKVSKDCRSVSQKGVKVKAGEMTEIVLVSQCKGDKSGLIDVVAGLNHPPKSIDLDYRSKHLVKCKGEGQEVEVTVCASAYDKDGDPMSFYWGQHSGSPLADGEPVVDTSEYDGKTKTECVTYTLPALDEGQANYAFKLSVFDKFIDEYGNEVHAEDWINDAFYKGEEVVKSRATVKFPVRAICKA